MNLKNASPLELMRMARGASLAGVKRSRLAMQLSSENTGKCGRERSLFLVNSNTNSNSNRDRPTATGGEYAAGTDEYQLQNIVQCRDCLYGLQFIIGSDGVTEDASYDDKVMALSNQKIMQFYRCLRLIEKNTAAESKTTALQKLYGKVCRESNKMIDALEKKKHFKF